MPPSATAASPCLPAIAGKFDLLYGRLALAHSRLEHLRMKRRRSRLKPLLSLWPIGVTVFLILAPVGVFWALSRDLVFTRKALPSAPVAKAKK